MNGVIGCMDGDRKARTGLEAKERMLRDLSLLAFGYALNKEGDTGRTRVLGTLKRGLCCHEIDELLQDLRTGGTESIHGWFTDHAAPIEHGKDPIQCALDRIVSVKQMMAVRKIMAEAQAAIHLLPEERLSIASMLRNAADELETLGGE